MSEAEEGSPNVSEYENNPLKKSPAFFLFQLRPNVLYLLRSDPRNFRLRRRFPFGGVQRNL